MLAMVEILFFRTQQDSSINTRGPAQSMAHEKFGGTSIAFVESLVNDMLEGTSSGVHSGVIRIWSSFQHEYPLPGFHQVLCRESPSSSASNYDKLEIQCSANFCDVREITSQNPPCA